MTCGLSRVPFTPRILSRDARPDGHHAVDVELQVVPLDPIRNDDLRFRRKDDQPIAVLLAEEAAAAEDERVVEEGDGVVAVAPDTSQVASHEIHLDCIVTTRAGALHRSD